MGYVYSFYMLLDLGEVISTQNHCKAFLLSIPLVMEMAPSSGLITSILWRHFMITLVLILPKLQGFPSMQRSPPLFGMIPGLGLFLLDFCLHSFLIPVELIGLNELSLLPISPKPQQPGMQSEVAGLLYMGIRWFLPYPGFFFLFIKRETNNSLINK